MDIKWTIHRCSPDCSIPIQLNPADVITTFSELYIPAGTLDLGLYQLNVTVTMAQAPEYNTAGVAYVQINPSGITANLVPLGTSIISSGRDQNLILDPGSYSIDPDVDVFNASVSHIAKSTVIFAPLIYVQAWTYQYFCRPFDLFHPMPSTTLPSIDQANQSCFVNRLSMETT